MAKILVVEDNLVNMELVSDLLEIKKYQVLKAISAQEAIDMAKSTLPDLILMDIQLPVISGLTAARTIKNNTATKEIPIVAISAFAMQSDRQAAKAAGCAGFIVKPIDTRAFLDIVEYFLINREIAVG